MDSPNIIQGPLVLAFKVAILAGFLLSSLSFPELLVQYPYSPKCKLWKSITWRKSKYKTNSKETVFQNGFVCNKFANLIKKGNQQYIIRLRQEKRLNELFSQTQQFYLSLHQVSHFQTWQPHSSLTEEKSVHLHLFWNKLFSAFKNKLSKNLITPLHTSMITI